MRSYLLCLEAIGRIEELVKELGDPCGFERRKSLYLASAKRDVVDLKKEYEARRRCGIHLDFLDRADIEARFSFSCPAALFSYDAAQVDAYRMTHRLIQKAAGEVLHAYDRTEVKGYDSGRNGVVLTTDRGCRIRAKKVVFATGYESYLKQKVARLRSTYALVSEPIKTFTGWDERCLIWETARPYFYLGVTSDGRALVGGEDDPFYSPVKRDLALGKKCRRLQKRFRALFPAIDLDVAYTWAGTFAETKDGLAYIGETGEFKNGYFALGYGGNGITYSVIAAEVIRDLYLGRKNRDAEIFRFDR